MVGILRLIVLVKFCPTLPNKKHTPMHVTQEDGKWSWCVGDGRGVRSGNWPPGGEFLSGCYEFIKACLSVLEKNRHHASMVMSRMKSATPLDVKSRIKCWISAFREPFKVITIQRSIASYSDFLTLFENDFMQFVTTKKLDILFCSECEWLIEEYKEIIISWDLSF